MEPRLIPDEKAKEVILGGNAIVTFVSKKTNKHFAYKVEKSNNGKVHWVSAMVTPNSNYSLYIGSIVNGEFNLTPKSKVTVKSPSYIAFQWTWNNLNHKDVEIWQGRIS